MHIHDLIIIDQVSVTLDGVMNIFASSEVLLRRCMLLGVPGMLLLTTTWYCCAVRLLRQRIAYCITTDVLQISV